MGSSVIMVGPGDAVVIMGGLGDAVVIMGVAWPGDPSRRH
jgi:hypothetical protein